MQTGNGSLVLKHHLIIPRKFYLVLLLHNSRLCILCLHLISGSENITRSQACTDFQSASLLRGSSLKVQFLLFSSSNPSCGQLLSTREDLQNSTFNATLGTKVIIHGFRYKHKKMDDQAKVKLSGSHFPCLQLFHLCGDFRWPKVKMNVRKIDCGGEESLLRKNTRPAIENLAVGVFR